MQITISLVALVGCILLFIVMPMIIDYRKEKRRDGRNDRKH